MESLQVLDNVSNKLCDDQTPPFPPIGPDVTGGSYDSGHAYDNPAALAWQYLPIDATYQNSYSVTGSSWSGGTETLTVSGIPNTNHFDGGFQLSGVSSACNPSGGELLMTSSSTTQVNYALASNPGVSCTGTMKWPDVRQFDERVYQNDSGGDPLAPFPPTGLGAVVHDATSLPAGLRLARIDVLGAGSYQPAPEALERAPPTRRIKSTPLSSDRAAQALSGRERPGRGQGLFHSAMFQLRASSLRLDSSAAR